MLVEIPWADLDEHSVYLAAIVAGLTALGWLLRKAWRGLLALRRFLREARRRFDALERLVIHELNPNSGSSLKDAMARVEAKVTRVEGRALMVHGLLDQHVEESRTYLADVASSLADQGITLPPVERTPRPADDTDRDDSDGR